ncbi:hypothetical protein ASF39_09545 [Methylobacterium sp. Leaf108]|nr:hypothetical protein ASF39_09545 [Methylobacterium sp. Leaf108]
MAAPVTSMSSALAALVGAALVTSAAQAGCAGAECYRHVSTPPVYGAVSERVLVRPAETVYRTTPPIYETVSEQVLVSAGGRVWQTSRDAYGSLVGCWVDVPPQYTTRHRRVLVQPAQSIPETIPAEYASVQRRVLVEPARAGWVPAPDAGGFGAPAYAGIGPGYGAGYGGHRAVGYRGAEYGRPRHRGYGHRGAGYGAYGPRADLGVGSIPDAVGMTGASSADVGVALGFSTGSIYDGY